jgi:2-dehydropantoate 2-reductase
MTTLFKEGGSRPNFLTGIVNHGVYATSQFSSNHVGLASAFIGPSLLAAEAQQSSRESSVTPFLAESIAACPELAVSLVSSQELLYIQLQKLTVNAVINPLSSVFDCVNGDLFRSASIRDLIDRLIEEISAVILAIIKTKTGTIDSKTEMRFGSENLKDIVYKIGGQTAKNISSMRQDMLAGRKTEIDYINGYIVAQGNALDIASPLNKKIVRLVKERKKVSEASMISGQLA